MTHPYQYGILLLDTEAGTYGSDGNETWPTSHAAMAEARHYYDNEAKYKSKIVKVYRIDIKTHEIIDFLNRNQLVEIFEQQNMEESVRLLPSDRDVRRFYLGGSA